jgi:polyribonucleotide nucleotidyltransferase
MEAAAFETESRQTATFTVPTKSVAQIVGKSGATIDGIKNESGAQIDIDKTSTDGKTTVTVRGDKKAIAAAKAAVLAVTEQIGDEIELALTVDPKYVSRIERKHR